MFEFLLTAPLVPFTLSLSLLLGLLILEVVFLLVGGSLLSSGEAEADFDIDAGVELSDISIPELDGLDVDLDLAEYELPGFEADAVAMDDAVEMASGNVFGWLGLGKVPFMIWLVAALFGYGLGGVIVQTGLNSLFGVQIPAALAAILLLPAGLGFARSFGTVFARAIPRVETTALSRNSLGRRRGVVSQGTARRGSPAEVRIVDGHGNMHYLRAEPLKDGEDIPQGSDVLVLRHRPSGGYRLVPLS